MTRKYRGLTTKDCLISYARQSVLCSSRGYVGKDVALDSMLAIYHDGKQITLRRISYQKKDKENPTSPTNKKNLCARNSKLSIPFLSWRIPDFLHPFHVENLQICFGVFLQFYPCVDIYTRGIEEAQRHYEDRPY